MKMVRGNEKTKLNLNSFEYSCICLPKFNNVVMDIKVSINESPRYFHHHFCLRVSNPSSHIKRQKVSRKRLIKPLSGIFPLLGEKQVVRGPPTPSCHRARHRLSGTASPNSLGERGHGFARLYTELSIMGGPCDEDNTS